MSVPAIPRTARLAVFWSGIIAVLVGLALYRTWEQAPWLQAAEYAALAAGALLVSWPLARVSRQPMAIACAVLWLAALMWFAGWLAVVATAFLALAALAVGTLVVPAGFPGRVPLAIVAGLAIIAAALGWLLIFPIHFQLVYLVGLTALIALRHRAIRIVVQPLALDLREASRGWQAVVAVLALGLASTGSWLPQLGSDSLAYHLALPWQLQELGYYRLDPASHIWALAPWSGDVLYAVVQLLAGAEGSGALNALWLLLTAALLWRLGEGLGLDRGLCWLGVALFASQPLTLNLLGQMQTEMPAMAGLLALALAIQRVPGRPDATNLRLIAVLAGFLLTLKLTLALMLLPMAAWLLWRWRWQLPWKALPSALAIGLAIGGSSYAYAWYISGNPVMPLFNSIFQSAYFDPVDFTGDGFFPPGIDAFPWKLVFDTSTYGEVYDGAAGFILVALAGGLALAIAHRQTRPLALVGLACFLLPLTQTQYLRYVHPALALLVPVMVAGARHAVPRNIVGIACVALCVSNVLFMANAQHSLTTGLLRLRVLEGNEAVFRRYAPERILAGHLRENAGDDYIALYPVPKRAFAAELAGHGLVSLWYDRQLFYLREAADLDASGHTWQQVFSLTGATHVVVSVVGASPALDAALSNNGATRVMHAGRAELWRLASPSGSRRFIERRNMAKRIRGF